MCGMAGAMSSWLTTGETLVFKHLALLATLRGEVGSGLMAIRQKRKHGYEIRRSEFSLADLTCSGYYDELDSRKNSVWLGHARLPTLGDTSINNVHPFKCGHIVGMHNGTLKSVMGQKIPDKTSDSRMFFQAVSEVGFEAVIRQTEGPGTFVWYDERQDTVNFYRNEGRPLVFAHYAGNKSVLYWASEGGMLYYVMNRLGGTDKKIVLQQLEPFTWKTFRARNYGGEINPIAVRKTLQPEPPKKETTTSVPVVPVVSSGTVSGADLSGAPYGSPSNNDNMTGASNPPNPPFVSYVETAPNKRVEYKHFLGLLEAGCDCCHKPARLADHHGKKLTWFTSTKFMCKSCMEIDPVARQYAESYLDKGAPLPQSSTSH